MGIDSAVKTSEGETPNCSSSTAPWEAKSSSSHTCTYTRDMKEEVPHFRASHVDSISWSRNVAVRLVVYIWDSFLFPGVFGGGFG